MSGFGIIVNHQARGENPSLQEHEDTLCVRVPGQVDSDSPLGSGREFSGRIVYSNSLARNATFLGILLENTSPEEIDFLKHLIHHSCFQGRGQINSISFYPPKLTITWREITLSAFLVLLMVSLTLSVLFWDTLRCSSDSSSAPQQEDVFERILDLSKTLNQ